MSRLCASVFIGSTWKAIARVRQSEEISQVRDSRYTKVTAVCVCVCILYYYVKIENNISFSTSDNFLKTIYSYIYDPDKLSLTCNFVFIHH